MDYRNVRLARIGNSPVIDFAAKELAKYMKMAAPELLVDEMVMEEAPKDCKALVLRVSQELAREFNVADAALDDGYRIDVTDDGGVIEGTNSRSVLLGAYRFLKELGFAFTRPGKEGERIPEKLPEQYRVTVCEKAAYRHRGVTIEGADAYQNIAEMIDFLPKCGLNEYFIQFWVPRTFFTRWYSHAGNPYLPPEDVSRETVEGFVRSLENEIARRGLVYQKAGHGWTCEPFGIDGTSWDRDGVFQLSEEQRSAMALVNGRRELWGNVPLNTNLCYSNPAVRETITNSIRDYSLAHPQIDVIHFWLADAINNHCECEECQKKQPSDWYVQMLNEVDEKLTAAGLKTRIVFLLYFDLLWEPAVERIKNPDRFILMFAPISRYYGENYADSPAYDKELKPYVRNRLALPKSLSENLARLKRWQAQFDGDSFIFDYHMQWAYLADPGAHFAAKNLFEDMCFLDQMGLGGDVSCQVQRCFFPSGLEFYCLGAGLWNNRQQFADVESDYYRQVFGADGPAVQEYLTRISELFTLYPYYGKKKVPADGKMEEGVGYRPKDLPYLKDAAALRALVDGFLPTIEQGLARQDQAQNDWQMLQLHARYVLMFGDVVEKVDAGDKEIADKAIEQMCDFVNQNELKLQKVLDVMNVMHLLHSRLRGNM